MTVFFAGSRRKEASSIFSTSNKYSSLLKCVHVYCGPVGSALGTSFTRCVQIRRRRRTTCTLCCTQAAQQVCTSLRFCTLSPAVVPIRTEILNFHPTIPMSVPILVQYMPSGIQSKMQRHSQRELSLLFCSIARKLLSTEFF